MVNLVERFGGSAGKIWEKLEQEQACSESKLKKKTKLKKEEFYGAIGWLAREDKIRREGRLYRLGSTNLTPEIGMNAGRVWRALNIWGELDSSNLAKLVDMNDKDLFTALGWLAREDKVICDPSFKRWRLK